MPPSLPIDSTGKASAVLVEMLLTNDTIDVVVQSETKGELVELQYQVVD